MPVLTGIPYDKSQHYCDYGSFNLNPRGSHILDRRDLYYKDGSSDKVYVVITSQKAQGTPDYYVDAFYGRRGGSLQHQPKAQVTDVSKATQMANKLLSEKKNKGYVDFIQGTPPTVKGQVIQNPNLKSSATFPPPDLDFPKWIQPGAAGGTRVTATAIMEDTLYILEEPLDGPRAYFNLPDSSHDPVTVMALDATNILNDVSVVLPHLIRFARGFSFAKNVVLDGHLMHPDPAKCNFADIWRIMTGGTPDEREKIYFKAIDLPFFGGNYLTNMEWKDRRKYMTGFFTDIRLMMNDGDWNMYEDFTRYPVVMHKYAYLKKEEFAEGKDELVAKHLRGQYKSPVQTMDTKDNWYKWKVGARRGKQG